MNDVPLVGTLLRNGAIYLLGVGLAVAGALGIAGAIFLDPILSAILFVVGISCVIAVHEFLDGPF